MTIEWKPFDYTRKAETKPRHVDVLYWIIEEFYEQGVTLGYFDGFTWRTSWGSDDCSVSWWAEIQYPDPPPDWAPQA